MSLVKYCAAVAASGCAYLALATAGALSADLGESASVMGPPPDEMPAIWYKWGPWTEIGGYAANREESRRGEATLWAPLVQSSSSLFFTDIRGKIFQQDQREGNIAVGYRQMDASGWNFGAWAGFDRRRSQTKNIFNQLSFGAEALSPDWDVRINGYIPLDDSKPVSSSSTSTSCTSSPRRPRPP
ncbi:MAG: inverse autotransporter beta domain-containing protein [Alphaproteobacteria bacterium]